MPFGVPENPQHASTVDYRAARGLDRALFQAKIAGRWHRAVVAAGLLAECASLRLVDLDRVVHNADRLQLKGDSLRKQKAPRIAAASGTTPYGRDHN
jgi:hypothetical protein